MSPIDNSDSSDSESNAQLDPIDRPDFERLVLRPVEQLTENMRQIVRRLNTRGALINVSTETLAFRLRQINQNVTEANNLAESLLGENWDTITMTPDEMTQNSAEMRRQIIIEALRPYMLALDTVLRINES